MRAIQRGDIFYRWFDNTNPPKNKFFVIMGETETELLGYFFINTNINHFIKRNQAFFEMQMSISNEDYPFLSYISFIDAHQIKKIDKSVILNELTSGKTQYKGKLKQDDKELLINTILCSDLFSEKEKQMFR